jgi:hypothetical protein
MHASKEAAAIAPKAAGAGLAFDDFKGLRAPGLGLALGGIRCVLRRGALEAL